ncbi:MAG: tRNA 2-thiouridine(34) synthase MnmA [Spirochaetota bacterium]|nr:tRNA 2-thiouridine(34) synthase MnmA [Spirochaetota bacterium]
MRIAVAMSGGVDSSVAAIMLKKLGHTVVGITINVSIHDNSGKPYPSHHYPSYILDAKRIAKQYDFMHKVLEVNSDFSNTIVHPFCDEYLRGRTPSPCIICNYKIKFKKIIDYAKSIGCDGVASGHYARIRISDKGVYYISRGLDKEKDQSYFLFMLSQEILQEIILPLGEYTKDGIIKMADSFNLHVAHKPESQEICFVSDQDYPGFIERIKGIIPPPGDILDTSGNVIGRHKGIHKYTIGQRRGLGISANKPLYVIEIDADKNIIIAGDEEYLYKKGLFATEINYMKENSFDDLTAYVKTRSSQKPFKASLKESEGGVYVYFEEPQMGVTPGQAAVFYDNRGNIIGGAWIEKGL